LSPTRTFTKSRTSSRTSTNTRTRTSTRTPSQTFTKSPTRTYTKTPTKSLTPYIGIRALVINFDTRGKELSIVPKYRYTCWGTINGVSDIVVFYRVDYTFPEKINGQCQTVNVWDIGQIHKYLQWKTGRVWITQQVP
jgi:hypothetical protein